jgi:hypothetical protein
MKSFVSAVLAVLASLAAAASIADNMKDLAHWSAESTTKFEVKKCIKALGHKECATLKMPGVKDDDLSIDVDGSIQIDTDTYTFMSLNQTVAFDFFGEKVSLPLTCEVGIQALEVCIDMKDPQASLEEMQEKYKSAKAKSDACRKNAQAASSSSSSGSKTSSESTAKTPGCAPSGLSCDIDISVLDKVAGVVDKLSGSFTANVCFSLSSQVTSSKIEGTFKGYAELGAELPSVNVKIAGKKFGTGSHGISTKPTLFSETLSIPY